MQIESLVSLKLFFGSSALRMNGYVMWMRCYLLRPSPASCRFAPREALPGQSETRPPHPRYPPPDKTLPAEEPLNTHHKSHKYVKPMARCWPTVFILQKTPYWSGWWDHTTHFLKMISPFFGEDLTNTVKRFAKKLLNVPNFIRFY